MAHLSVVIPVFQAEECMDELYRRLCSSLAPITSDFEIVLVEDGGRDRSWEKIQELAAADHRVRGLQFSRNFGQHYGITAGLDVCDGDWVVVMDCDLQDRPEEIPRLYARALEGYDVVLARRGLRRDGWLKRTTSHAFYAVFKYLTEMQYDEQVGNFRIMSRQVVLSFRQLRERLRFFGGLMTWLGFRVGSVDVVHAERFAGSTSYDYRKLVRLAVDTIIAYSDKPLRLAIRLGFAMAALSLAAGIFFLVRALTHRIPVSGWASLIVSLYFIGGIVVGLLGMLGLYIGKMFDETKRRPLYIVRRTTYTPAP
ncbi:MAG: glycosyltransferase family 2 protein [Gemmatimonadota bacterium]|nr:glycosyltransferase family 2 protein [Gemmatimonadota bacterium]